MIRSARFVAVAGNFTWKRLEQCWPVFSSSHKGRYSIKPRPLKSAVAYW